MSGNRSTVRPFDGIRARGNVVRVNELPITTEEYVEILGLTDTMLAQTDIAICAPAAKRDPSDPADGPLVIHLLPEIVAHFCAQGAGWQARINAVLLEAVERERGQMPR